MASEPGEPMEFHGNKTVTLRNDDRITFPRAIIAGNVPDLRPTFLIQAWPNDSFPCLLGYVSGYPPIDEDFQADVDTTTTVQPNNKWRIKLSAELIERIQLPRNKDGGIVVGLGRTFEIWSRQNWDDYIDEGLRNNDEWRRDLQRYLSDNDIDLSL